MRAVRTSLLTLALFAAIALLPAELLPLSDEDSAPVLSLARTAAAEDCAAIDPSTGTVTVDPDACAD